MDQQVKGVELNGAGFQSVMLEQVEREPAFIIHGDDFTVSQRLTLKPLAGSRDLRELIC